MHTTHERKKPLSAGFTIKTERIERGNLFGINAQIAQAAMADKRNVRRRIKAARKARNWKGD